jgi:hypothetical protein
MKTLTVVDSEDELARAGIQWRGFNESIRSVADLVPRFCTHVLRLLNGLQHVPSLAWRRAHDLLEIDAETATRAVLADLEREHGPIEPLIGELDGARLSELLGLLAPDHNIYAHYWSGCAPKELPVPPDRVFTCLPAELIAAISPADVRPPTTLWSESHAWLLVSYTDSPSTYLGCDQEIASALKNRTPIGSAWVDPTSLIDDWIYPS